MEVFEDESLTDSSEIQSNSALPVKKAPLTPIQVSVRFHITEIALLKVQTLW